VYHVEKVPYKYYVHPLIVKIPIEYFHSKHEDFGKHHDENKDEHHHDDVDMQQYEQFEQPTIVEGGQHLKTFDN